MKPSTKRVLRVLQNVGEQGATTHYLCQPYVGGLRFGARIAELRQEGYRITSTPVRAGSYRYRLHTEDDT